MYYMRRCINWIAYAILPFGFALANETPVLEVGKVYRLECDWTDFHTLGRNDNGSALTARRFSRFRVVSAPDEEDYYVVFESLTKYRAKQSKSKSSLKTGKSTSPKPSSTANGLADASGAAQIQWEESTVKYRQAYRLGRKYEGKLNVAEFVSESVYGPISGTLVVPFKYRLDTKTISGDAGLGYYVGWSWALGPRRLSVSPIFSAGISQVSIESTSKAKSTTAVTVAGGLLLRNWSGVNIGFVAGFDKTGEDVSVFPHEGEPWISFMVGWVL